MDEDTEEAESATKALEPSDTESEGDHLGDNGEEAFTEVTTVTVGDVQSEEEHVFTTTGSIPDHLLGGRTTLQIGEGLGSQKATLIVVHADGSIVEAAGLKSAAAALASAVAAPEKDSKYNWDPSVFNNQLPVRCRNTSGVLHKNRLGSGGKGRCIKHNNKWFTPTEFEGVAGRASSKDWKRSIRYAGRPLQCLIQERILSPHAASCTCAACCDDLCLKEGDSLESENISMTGPVRLFVPYKRRKKDPDPSDKKDDSGATFTVSPSGQITSGGLTFDPPTPSQSPAPNHLFTSTSVLSPLPPTVTVTTPPLQSKMSAPPSPGGLEVMTSLGPAHGEVMSSLGPAHTEVMTSLGPTHTEVMTSLGPTHTEVMTSLGPTHGGVMTSLGPALSQVTMTTGSEPALSHAPRGPWLYLEQLADTLLSNAQQLKALIGQAKQETCQSETGTLGHLTRKEVSQFQSVSFQTDEPETKRSSDLTEINVCVNCGRAAMSECAGCHKINYCSTFCQKKDWKEHQHSCQPGAPLPLEEDPLTTMDITKVMV